MDDQSCEWAVPGYNCDGTCINDADGDGVCDEYETMGCQDPLAYNYSEGASDPGTCDYQADSGCTYAHADNFDVDALWDDGSCLFGPSPVSCAEDLNADGIISINDLLQLLGVYGDDCE